MSINATEKGAPIYLKDNAWASKFFNSLHEPKTKFNFICGIFPRREINPSLYTQANHQDFWHLVKTAEPPKPNIDTEIVDQYNKRRIIQKKITWEPVTITFHDDSSSLIYAIIMDYLAYYYKEFHNTELQDWRLDTVSNLINDTDWGYRTNFEKYYFHNISIIWMSGGRGTRIRMVNPIITNIQFDTLDYADGSTPLEISITFEYEGVRVKSINAPIVDDTDLGLAKLLMEQTDEIGQPFDDPQFHPGAFFPGQDRSPGLGELFAAGVTFYGKHNGKPTVKNLVDDLILRPAKGVASSSINSWGNFNFGGISNAKNIGGLLGGGGNIVGNQVGDIFKVANSGNIIQDIFSFGSGGSSSG